MTPLSSPKERFQALRLNLERHKAMTELPEFELAVDTALLEYANRLTSQTPTHPFPPEEASANFYRLEGARSVFRELIALAEQPTISKRADFDNLNHKA